MLHHIDLERSPSPLERVGVRPSEQKRNLSQLVKQGEIALGGNKGLKIYGTLSCTSGKRMKTENRVFFSSEYEAIRNGYRPCGNCMKQKYHDWKDGSILLSGR